MLSGLIDKVISLTPPRILGHALRSTPREFIDWKKNEAFKYLIRYVYKNSKFYRKKFDEHKIDPLKVKAPSDLGNFYTTPNDIIEHAEEFLCRAPHMVFESSGTTGRNKRVYFTYDELDEIGRLNAFGFSLWGIGPSLRCVNAFDFCIWIPGMIMQKGLEKSGNFGMAAGKVDPVEVYKRIPIYKFDVVMGEPTWLIKLTEIAEKNGAYPLKFLVTGAENMPESARPWMEKVWQGARVIMTYASVESGGAIGAEIYPECESYHIDENGFFVDIADPCPDGYGEVVFTTLSRRTMPLIRYRNRDVTRIIDQKCACGIPYRRLAKMRGRRDEMVVASGGNIYPLMFEEVLKDVEGVTSDWQIVLYLRGIKEVMQFNLELKGNTSKEAVQENIFANIRNRYPDLWKNYSIAIFEIEFAYHNTGDVRSERRKLLRLVDNRYAK
jgi:phenylacetate-CoA ligase